MLIYRLSFKKGGMSTFPYFNIITFWFPFFIELVSASRSSALHQFELTEFLVRTIQKKLDLFIPSPIFSNKESAGSNSQASNQGRTPRRSRSPASWRTKTFSALLWHKKTSGRGL